MSLAQGRGIAGSLRVEIFFCSIAPHITDSVMSLNQGALLNSPLDVRGEWYLEQYFLASASSSAHSEDATSKDRNDKQILPR